MYTPTHTHIMSCCSPSTPAVVHPKCLHSLLKQDGESETEGERERESKPWMDKPGLFVRRGFPVLTGTGRGGGKAEAGEARAK